MKNTFLPFERCIEIKKKWKKNIECILDGYVIKPLTRQDIRTGNFELLDGINDSFREVIHTVFPEGMQPRDYWMFEGYIDTALFSFVSKFLDICDELDSVDFDKSKLKEDCLKCAEHQFDILFDKIKVMGTKKMLAPTDLTYLKYKYEPEYNENE